MVTPEQYEPADASPDASAAPLIAALRSEQLQAIDAAILSAASNNWRKVALVVGTAMGSLPGRAQGIPDVFYAQRVSALVSRGRLEGRGDLSRMRYGEVRIPGPAKA